MRLIDADELYSAIKTRYRYCTEYKNSNYDDGFKIALSLCMCDINAEPTVEVEPIRHGHWNKRYYPMHDGSDLEMFWCSNCREEFSYDAETGISITDSNYCPNCGARMDGKE